MTRDQSRQAEFFAKKADEQRKASFVPVDTACFSKTKDEKKALKEAKLLNKIAMLNKKAATA